MSLLVNALLNFARLLRNTRRALHRSPDFVWIPVTGALPEFEPSRRGLLRRHLDPRTLAPSLEGIRSRLDRVLADGRVGGVILRVENLAAGWAALEELRTEIERFRKRGKQVVAYLPDGGDTRSYYLASAADEVFASPLSTLNLVGLRVRVNFLKDALSHLGLETEVIAVSPYKSAADPISRTDFSKESREQVERLLDWRFDELVSAISARRDVPSERVRNLIDNAPYAAGEAVEKKLLDGALYEDELAGRFSNDDKPARLVEWVVARKVLRVPYRRRARKVVGLVSVEGTVVRGSSRKLPVPLPLLGREQAGSDSVVAALRVAEKSRRIGSILLHVDSPGGDALASDLIWREVERIQPKKPVVVLMGNAAASGGYYVSAAATPIVARRGTLTGSIGVLAIRPVALGLYEKLGINPVALERGARAGLLDPSRRPCPDDLRVIEGQIGRIYTEFKDRVARGRGNDLTDLEGMAGGRVWTGIEALELGLVDETGGFRDALSKARELGGIDRDVPGVLTKVNPPRGVRPIPPEPAQTLLDALGEMWLTLSELRAGGVLALAPYEISEG